MRDLVIVGGGPAGLAVGIAARLRGLDALVVEGREPPVDKACGEGIMPDGVARLRRLGVCPPPGHHRPFQGIRYLDEGTSVEARFPGEPGLLVRRPPLHAAMVARAAEVGLEVSWRTAVTGLATDGVETAHGLLRGHWIVGADGLHSRVRRWAGLEGAPAPHRRFGLRRHYRTRPWSDLVEVYWGSGCEAYVGAPSEEEVGVALLWSGEKRSFERLLESFPRLRERLAGAVPASHDRGAGPLEQRARRVVAGRVALVGDAAGYRDAITGEGLAVAFHQAYALVEAVAAGNLRHYARSFPGIVRLPFAFIRLLLLAERRPWLRRRFLAALERQPSLFERLLAIHARELPLRSLGLLPALRLCLALSLPSRR